MEGVLLLDLHGALILRSRFQSSAYPLSIIDSLVYYIQQNRKMVPTILHLPNISSESMEEQIHEEESSQSDLSSLDEGKGSRVLSMGEDPWKSSQLKDERGDKIGSICCNVIKGGLWLVGVAKADLEPSTIFDYLHQFLDLLRDTYSIQMTPSSIQTHFDLVYQILHITSPSSNSSPYGKNLFDPGLIQEMLPVPQSSIVTLISQATETLTKVKSSQKIKPSIFSSNIPWRPAGLSYLKQEIFVDLIETVSVVLDSNGQLFKGELNGNINVQSKLSGMPDVMMSFVDSNKLTEDNIGFHRSIRQTRWTKNRRISFIPPDGKFELMTYRITQLDRIPIRIKPIITQGSCGGSFKIRIEQDRTLPIGGLKFLTISWFLGDLATGLISEQLECRRKSDGSKALLNWDWNDTTKIVRWNIDGQDIDCCVVGVWTHSAIENKPSPSISLEFESVPGHSVSGLKIEKLDLVNGIQTSPTVWEPASVAESIRMATTGGGGQHSGGQSQFNVRKGVKSIVRSGKYEVRW